MSETGTCWECGVTGEVHAHHPVPRSRGGKRTIDLCLTCHGKAHERRMSTSQLTREGLMRVRNEGRRLGGARLGVAYSSEVDRNGRRVVVPVEDEMRAVAAARAYRAEGLTLRAVAARLTAEGYATKCGGRWHAQTVNRVCQEIVP